MSIHAEIGQNILALRKEKNMTQEFLALEAEMSVSYLRSIEHGEANPSMETLSRIANALNEPFGRVVATREHHEEP